MPKYCVANFAKHKGADIKGLQDEANRDFEDKDKYKNPIDWNQTDKNRYFAKSEDWKKSIEDILKKYEIKPRKDAVLFTTTVYGFSKEWEEDLLKEKLEKLKEDEALQGEPQEKLEKIAQKQVDFVKHKYFEECFKFENTRGECFSAMIHTDESGNWHMHTATVPVIDHPTQEGKKSLSAKRVFGNKKHMSEEQTRFFEQCGMPFGMERGACRVDTDEKVTHRTEQEYKIHKDNEALAEREAEVTAKEDAVKVREDNATTREDSVTTRENDVTTREDDVKTREDSVTTREDSVKTREDAITESEAAVKRHRMGVNKYKADVEEREAKVKVKESEVAEKLTEVQAQAATVAKMKADAEELDEKARTREASVTTRENNVTIRENDVTKREYEAEELLEQAKPTSMFRNVWNIIKERVPQSTRSFMENLEKNYFDKFMPKDGEVQEYAKHVAKTKATRRFDPRLNALMSNIQTEQYEDGDYQY